MKTLKILFATLVIGLSFTACSVTIHDVDDPYYYTLEDVVTGYDLWYVDYHRTTGSGDVPFVSKAFTLSFLNGKLYANNNLVGIGAEGGGYGIHIGYYDTFDGILEIDHKLDGYYDFDVIEISSDLIKLRDNYNDVTYFLEGYYKGDFDYDQIFYDNIEYFLQEYDAWEKTYISDSGELNEFDNENFLSFTPENVTTFYSSKDEFGTNIADLLWDYVGDYSIADVNGYDDLKILTLDYDFDGNEEFELSVINDRKISLYHLGSGTTYEFTGRGYIQYMKPKSSKSIVRNDGRKRTKVERVTKNRVQRNLK